MASPVLQLPTVGHLLTGQRLNTREGARVLRFVEQRHSQAPAQDYLLALHETVDGRAIERRRFRLRTYPERIVDPAALSLLLCGLELAMLDDDHDGTIHRSGEFTWR